jgi:hypothetical protein
VNKIILNWQRPLWEGDWEVVKRSGRDELIQVVIHMCVETMLGISLYSYSYLKLSKILSFLLSLMTSLQQNWRRGQNRFCLEVRKVGGRQRMVGGPEGGIGIQTLYTHMNKCINNFKINLKIKNKDLEWTRTLNSIKLQSFLR